MSNIAARLPGLSAVVPAYNSQHSLPELVARLQPVLAAHAAAYELIVVNDGSRDGTWACSNRSPASMTGFGRSI